MDLSKRKVLVKIAAWYDILLGIVVFTLAHSVFSLFHMDYPDDPLFLYSSGLFVLAFGYILLKIPLIDPNFKLIASVSAFVRISFFLIILMRFALNSEFIFGYFLLGFLDCITGCFLILTTID